MNEASDGLKDKLYERKDQLLFKVVLSEDVDTTPNLNESASRPHKMVEVQKSSSTAGTNIDRTRSEKSNSDRKYDSRYRTSYKSVNGIRASPADRSRRDDDRRTSPSKPVRKQDLRNGSSSSGSYRRETYDLKKSSETLAESNKTLVDDSRLTKYVRRVQREQDRERRLSAAKQLVEYLNTPEGVTFATMNSDELLDELKEILLERGYKDVKNEVIYCIGLVGSLIDPDSQHYFKWLFAQVNSMIDDDVRALFLQALQETIRCYEKKLQTADFTLVMNNLQILLENADTPQLLISIVNVIIQITKLSPHVFAEHFRDTVDILVGWHIDSSQRDRVVEFTSQALVAFQQFWVSDQSFTKELLGQFLEDMEAYAEELGIVMQNDHGNPTAMPDEALKIGSLLRVFSTVIKSLGQGFDPHKSRHLNMSYFIDVFDKMVQAIDASVKWYFSDYTVLAANECLMLLLNLVKSECVVCQKSILDYVSTILAPKYRVTNRYVTSALLFTRKVIEALGTKLPVIWLTEVLGPKSILQSYKMSISAEVLKSLTAVYKTLLGLKNIPLLEETYRHLLGDIQQSYNTLLESSGDDNLLDLVPNNPFKEKVYDRCEAEAVCLFNLNALGEIGNTKNNLMGMWALSPGLFDLYCKHLDVVRPSISIQYPALQYAILHSLYYHSTRHGNFISTSSLLIQNTPVEGSILATSHYLSRLLKMLSDLLTHANTSFDSKLLALKWVSEIIANLTTSAHAYTTRQFLTLVQALYHVGHDQEADVARYVHLCLTCLFKNSKLYPVYIVKGCVKLCMYKLSEGSADVSKAFFSLLSLLPLNVSTSKDNGLYLLDENTQLVYSESTVGLQAMWQVCRNYSTQMPLGTFHSHNFRQVMGYLLHNVKMSKPGSQSFIECMFQSAQRTNSKPDLKSSDGLIIQNYITNNISVEWFWATWEAAQFCILTRLKTPLGKPQETFTSIEAVLKSFAAEVSDSNGELEENNKKKNKPSSSHELLIRVKLLLQFMEQLEKQLFNAYEGSAVSMSVLPKAVRTFFHTNKNTCLEWLLRVRMYMIKVALHSGLYTVVIRQASELLQDMKTNDNTQGCDFEIVIQYLVQALCCLGDADAVQGIYSWCKDVIGRKFTWIKASVEKANRRFESAAKEYKLAVRSVLQLEGDREESVRDTENNSANTLGLLGRSGSEPVKLDPSIAKLNMFVNEIVDCYMQLNDWDSIQNWQETFSVLRASSTLTFPPPTYTVDMNFIKAQASYDSGAYKSVKDYLDLIPALSNLSKWGLTEKVQLAQSKLLHASAILQEHTVNNHKSEIVELLKETIEECQSILKIQGMDWPILVSQDVMSLLTIADTLLKQVQDRKVCLLPLSEKIHLDESDHRIQSFLQAIQIVKLQQALDRENNTDLSEQLLQLNLGAACLARKQHNYQLVHRLLLNQTNVGLSDNASSSVTATVDMLKIALKALHAMTVVKELDILRLDRETAKLLHSIGESHEAVDLLTNSVAEYSCSDKARTSLCNELCSRSLLTLVKWLQVDHKMLSIVASQVGQGDGVDAKSNNMQLLLDVEERASLSHNNIITGATSDLKIGDNPILTDTDRIIGRLLNLSTLQCDSLSKSWYTLAGWCYKWGRKAVDNASHGSVQLFTDEKVQIISILPENSSHEEKECVLNILSQIHSGISSEEDISDQDQSQYDDGTETTRRQLLVACPALQAAGGSRIDSLLDVWKGVVHRIYHYYQLSASAYFRFLKLNGETDPVRENTEDCNVISTLRLLRLLVKHAWELRSVLEAGLAVTPTAPWKGIIPQLFSRLSHPEAYVRQSIADLLCRVAEDAPHLIVYPAVVGSSTTKMETKSESGFLNNYLTEEIDNEKVIDHIDDMPSQDEDDLPELEADSILHNCILSMLNTLSANFPQMISDVKQLIEELRRITLLWDELWLGTLNQQHQDVERRISQLENEIRKVDKNMSLTKEEKAAIILEKHKTVLKPTMYMMERLNEITSQPTETPHERWFQDTYGLLIANALEKLRNPPNPSHPRASWHPFKQIHVSLQQKAQKRNSLILSMEEISPKLYCLRNTVIAMPGLGTSGHIITIESVSNTVQILPTKTKPKKLVFKGSDGKRYPYLFKGLEDLHLDERIMQFLNIVNNMFASGNKGSHELYRARHYSVTPLGPRSGLIQWVDGVTPLFALYKRWQQREAQVQQNKQQASGTSSGVLQQTNIPRPSEVYYEKLSPLLREKGIKDLDNRKDWPLAVQRQVLEDLMSNTPRDLLAKELWCTSTGPNEWWYVTQTYARSTAVMSMIGYIIGLGDRHLDNVLVDLSTGEVVHIDYNVCFEKGKGLRVPERVPFRLTQNIEAALGITGIEGTFRLACEHVMKTLRKGRETLLTLLEAFVYDPLVDWTTGNEGGYTGAFYGGGLATGSNAIESRQSKHDMEREITTSMFSIRVTEMKVPWIRNREELLAVLPSMQAHIDTKAECLAEYSQCLIDEERLQQLKQVVLEAQLNPSSPIFTLHDRYKEYLVIKTTQDAVNKMVEDKISECINWQQMHKLVMQKIQGSVFQKMCADIASSVNLGTPSFAAAKEFLQGAGQGSIIQQCEQVENELTSNLQIQRGNLRRVIDILHTYGTIVSQFGVSFADNMRTSNYLHWLQALLNDFTENKCGEIVHHFHELYGDAVYPQIKVQLTLGTDNKLQSIIQDINIRLFKLLERRSLEKADTVYLDMQVQESKALIENFVTENGQSGVSSLKAVIVTALCALNKRNLQMEAAANSAGDRLLDLTSRDGDWFLEELCSMSANVCQFLDMMKSFQHIDDTAQFAVLYKGMITSNHVYTALQELIVNYRTIILPEALKIIQSQESTVFSILSQLETILQKIGPLDSLICQLETLHRNAVMGIMQENGDLLDAVQSIQRRFLHMLEGSGNQDLTPGQMLLMGFNGLFTRLDDEFGNLLENMDNVQVPDLWKKVDVIREARSLQLSTFTMDTRSLLSYLFFIRRLQVMHEFFHMCTQFAAAIQGLEGGNCYDDEQLSRPVKRFIADYVQKQVIGFPSQVLGYILCTIIHSMGLDVTAEIELKDIGAESKTPLDEICKKGVDLCIRTGQFQQVHLTQASSLTSNLDASWRRHDLTRRLDSNIELLKLSLQRTQLHVTRLHWLHEDLFTQDGRQPYQMMVANRSSIMSEVKKCMQALTTQESNLVSCHCQYSQLESSITQRLKWAAGANPSLNLVLQQFEEVGLMRKQLAEVESKQSQEVISMCQGILHLEALRTRTPEAMASDTNFLSLISRCSESCMMVTTSSCAVTEAEAMLMEILPLEDGQKTDLAWLKATLKEISNHLKDMDKKQLTLKSNIDEAKDGIKTEVNSIRTLLTVHHKLMSDIRAILKTLAKQEEQEYGEHVDGGGIMDYLNLYKRFSDNLTMVLKLIVNDDFTAESLTETRSITEALQVQIPRIYDDLIALAPPLISNKPESRTNSPLSFATAVKKQAVMEESQLRRQSILQQEHLMVTPPTGSPLTTSLTMKAAVSTPVKKTEKLARDPKTGKAIQERNSYAVGVWRRVKMKLDGRDPDQNKRLSVAEQVEFVIKDATNLDNLAVLYEGWTPWV